jgi:sulfite reductase (NADPH) hemoprotein beta-component
MWSSTCINTTITTALVFERVAQFRDQVERFIAGELSEEEFLLRLQNGLYLQKHAYMLRVAIPYGTLSAEQMRTLASIAAITIVVTATSPRGRTCSSTGSNWRRCRTSSNAWPGQHACDPDLRQLRAQHHHRSLCRGRGRRADRPAPAGEILRQWSTINPEFLFLPRKFKIAICSAEQDRAAIMMHDIGLYLYPGATGKCCCG